MGLRPQTVSDCVGRAGGRRLRRPGPVRTRTRPGSRGTGSPRTGPAALGCRRPPGRPASPDPAARRWPGSSIQAGRTFVLDLGLVVRLHWDGRERPLQEVDVLARQGGQYPFRRWSRCSFEAISGRPNGIPQHTKMGCSMSPFALPAGRGFGAFGETSANFGIVVGLSAAIAARLGSVVSGCPVSSCLGWLRIRWSGSGPAFPEQARALPDFPDRCPVGRIRRLRSPENCLSAGVNFSRPVAGPGRPGRGGPVR